MKTFVLFLFLSGTILAVAQDELPRQGNLGFVMREPSGGNAGAVVRTVEPGSSAEKAGVGKDDIVLKINSVLLADLSSYNRALMSVDGNTRVNLTLLENGRQRDVSLEVPPLKKEGFNEVTTYYGHVTSSFGYRVRTIITRPKNLTGRLPAMLFVRWIDCDACEFPNGPRGGHELFLQDLATKTGMVLMRVEKHGAGDSEGPPCNDADFAMELAAHRAAFQALQKLDYVDPSKIFVVGQSNGAGVAPLVVDGAPVAGFIIFGGWVKTWYEHVLEFERNRYELDGDSPAEVTRKLKLVSEFYSEYLNKKRSPGDILKGSPHLKEIWSWGDLYQFDMTINYFQQLQDLNLAEAWSKVKAPVLSLYGEYDWVMSRDDHQRISKLASHPQSRFVQIPKMNHSLLVFPDLQTSFKDGRSGKYDPAVIDAINSWILELSK